MQINWVRASLIGTLIVFSISMLIVVDSIHYLAYKTPQLIQINLDGIRNDLNTQLTAVRNDTDTQIEYLRRDLINESAEYRKTLDSRFASIQGDSRTILAGSVVSINNNLDENLKRLNTTLEATKNSIDNELDRAEGHIQAVHDTFHDQEPMVYSRFLATTGELNKTLDALRLTANELSKSAPDIVQNTKDITFNASLISKDIHTYTTPEKWYKTLIFIPMRTALHVNLGQH